MSLHFTFEFKDRVGKLPHNISVMDIAVGSHPASPDAKRHARLSALFLSTSLISVGGLTWGLFMRRREKDYQQSTLAL